MVIHVPVSVKNIGWW